MSSMNFPDPNVTPEYKDWVWDGEKWVKDCPASGSDSGGGGGWTLLSSVEANNSSVAQFTEFSDEFDDYKIIISDVIPSAKAALRMYIALDGVVQGSGYRWHNNHSTTSNNAYAGQSNNGTNRFTLFQDLPVDDTSLASMEISAFGANNPAIGKTFFWNGICFYNGAGNLSFGAGLHNSIGKLTEMGIQMGNGKILSGNFKLYGIKK